MDQCVHPLPLSGSCDQHRDKRRLGHCSTHQGQEGCLGKLQVVEKAMHIPCMQTATSDCHSQYTDVTCHLAP